MNKSWKGREAREQTKNNMESNILAKIRRNDLEAFNILKGQLFFNIISRVEICKYFYL